MSTLKESSNLHAMKKSEKSNTAYDDLMATLEPNEAVEAIVFGSWGDFGGEGPDAVSNAWQGRVLNLEEARALMNGWRFVGGFGGAATYPCYVWTSKRVIFVHEYDGSTCLSSVPRNPISCAPEFGGCS